MAQQPKVGRRPSRAMLMGVAIGLIAAVVLVWVFAATSGKSEKALKPVPPAKSTQR